MQLQPHANIGYQKFPTQGAVVGRGVTVTFADDVEHSLPGELIRDDMQAPYLVIIRLRDGRCVLGTECRYSFV